jgi:hypothetical protein
VEGAWPRISWLRYGQVKVVTEESSLKPYWGKPAVRNFRGGGGNVSMAFPKNWPALQSHICVCRQVSGWVLTK